MGTISEIKEITIALPLKEIKKDSANYELVITDANGIDHYFNEDGTYDGYSKDPCIPLEDPSLN